MAHPHSPTTDEFGFSSGDSVARTLRWLAETVAEEAQAEGDYRPQLFRVTLPRPGESLRNTGSADGPAVGNVRGLEYRRWELGDPLEDLWGQAVTEDVVALVLTFSTAVSTEPCDGEGDAAWRPQESGPCRFAVAVSRRGASQAYARALSPTGFSGAVTGDLFDPETTPGTRFPARLLLRVFGLPSASLLPAETLTACTLGRLAAVATLMELEHALDPVSLEDDRVPESLPMFKSLSAAEQDEALAELARSRCLKTVRGLLEGIFHRLLPGEVTAETSTDEELYEAASKAADLTLEELVAFPPFSLVGIADGWADAPLLFDRLTYGTLVPVGFSLHQLEDFVGSRARIQVEEVLERCRWMPSA